MSLISLYKVFSKSLPSPPQWSKQTAARPNTEQVSPQGPNLSSFASGFSHSSASFVQSKDCSHENRRLQRTLRRFARTLRFVHNRKIYWPENESFPDE